MVKLAKFVVLFTLMALMAVSPVLSQDSAQIDTDAGDVILSGVIARGNQFASILDVFTPSSTNYNVVWGEDGRVLYQTPQGEQIIGVDPSGDMLVIQRDGTLILGSITSGSYMPFRFYSSSRGYFSVLFTDVGTFFVLAVIPEVDDSWKYSLAYYSLTGDLLGEWDVPGVFLYLQSYSLNGQFVVVQELPEGGPRLGINLDDGTTFEVDHNFDDPMDLRLERTYTVEGVTASLRMCEIDVRTGECIPGTIVESVGSAQRRDVAYIYRPVQVPGSNMLAGFGWAVGLNQTTFLVVDNGPEWDVVGWFDESPSQSLFYGSDLRSFAINQQGEAALVWGNWATGYEIRRAFLQEAVDYRFPVEDLTGDLYPTYDQILEALPQQG